MSRTLLLIAFLLSSIPVTVVAATGSPVSYSATPSSAAQRPGPDALNPYENRAERPTDRMPADWWPTSDSLYPISIAGVVQFPYLGNIVVQGNYAYASSGSGLKIFDISNPAAPVIVSKLFVESGAHAHTVAVSGGIAYIAPLRGDRFMTIDVSDPAHPQVLGTCNPPGLPWDIKIHGNFAYAVLSETGLVAIDISNPAAPVTVGLVAGTEHTYEFEIVGDYIIAASHLDIKTVSLADPAHPTVVSTYSDLPTQVVCPALALQGNYIYVGADTAIYVLDVSDPASLSLAGQCSGISGSMSVASNYLFNVLGMQGMTIFDISNPTNPVLANQLPGNVWNVVTSGNRLYLLGSSPSIFSIWDINIPAGPSLLGSFTGPSSDLRDVAIAGNIAAIATDQLYLVNISNPTAPEMVGMVIPEGSGPYANGFWSVEADGQYVYAVGDQKLKVFDISNPANPAEVSSVYDEAYALLGVSGKTAVSCAGGILCTFDISAPQNPVQQGRIDLGTMSTYDLKVRGDYAYIVADYYTGVLIIVDISDPAHPAQTGIFQAGYSVRSHAVEIEGNVAFLATGYWDLDVIDISNPANPVRIGRGITYETSSDMSKSGDYMFSADLSFSIYDTYIGNSPVAISTRFLGGGGSHLIANGNYSYLLANGCLMILSTPQPNWMMGDADGSGAIDVSDAVRLIEYIFVHGEPPFPPRLGDANCDHAIDISDVVYLIGYVFGGGPAPCGK